MGKRSDRLRDNPPVRGRTDGWAVSSEAEHFLCCNECGQPIDCRDLEAVLHHEHPVHLPLAPLDATRMVQGPNLRAALIGGWRPGQPGTVH